MKLKTIVIVMLILFLSGYALYSYINWYYWDELGWNVNFWFVIFLPLIVFSIFTVLGFVLAYRKYIVLEQR